MKPIVSLYLYGSIYVFALVDHKRFYQNFFDKIDLPSVPWKRLKCTSFELEGSYHLTES